ncbi:MAG: inovirus Gp2 family protein [Alcanivoracaceae bacterium]|nr:inovirus Gp2 family protein [Alcanivoracaceae bacterium]
MYFPRSPRELGALENFTRGIWLYINKYLLQNRNKKNNQPDKKIFSGSSYEITIRKKTMEIYEPSSKLIYSSSWMGYPILDQHAPFYEAYLYRALAVIEHASRQYPKVFAIRFDLRLPKGFDESDTAVISRFIASLDSQIREDFVRHANQQAYLPSCKLRYLWGKERGDCNEGLHYHVAILLNHKRYSALGRYVQGNSLDMAEFQRNMAYRICKAWMSATYEVANPSLVHFCENGTYVLDRSSPQFLQQKSELVYRLSYLAKVYSKETVLGRKFGASRR